MNDEIQASDDGDQASVDGDQAAGDVKLAADDVRRFNDHLIACLRLGVPLDLGFSGSAARSIAFLNSQNRGDVTALGDAPPAYRQAVRTLSKREGSSGSAAAIDSLRIPQTFVMARRRANERWLRWCGLLLLAAIGLVIFANQVIPRLIVQYEVFGLTGLAWVQTLQNLVVYPWLVPVVVVILMGVVFVWCGRGLSGPAESSSGTGPFSGDPAWSRQVRAAHMASRYSERLRRSLAGDTLFTIFAAGGLVMVFGFIVFYSLVRLLDDLSRAVTP